MFLKAFPIKTFFALPGYIHSILHLTVISFQLHSFYRSTTIDSIALTINSIRNNNSENYNRKALTQRLSHTKVADITAHARMSFPTYCVVVYNSPNNNNKFNVCCYSPAVYHTLQCQH